MEHINVVPAWAKHAPDIGLTVVDLVAPFFIFAIGLTSGEAQRRRLEREGPKRTFEHVVKRAMALVGIGSLFSLGENSFVTNPHAGPWGTLQAIGIAVLLSSPTLFLGHWARLAVGLALAGAYQFALDGYWLETVLASNHAGIQGSLSWTALLILGTVFADLFRLGHIRRYWALAGVLGLAGLALGFAFPISKHRMSISFDLVVCSLSALAFGLTDLWVVRRKKPMEFLVTWGRNPLVLYVSHLFLMAVFLLPETPGWHVEAGPLQAVVQGAAFVAVLDQWARFLSRRNFYLSL